MCLFQVVAGRCPAPSLFRSLARLRRKPMRPLPSHTPQAGPDSRTVEGLEWYALKVFYNKVFEVKALLEREPDLAESYIPCFGSAAGPKGGKTGTVAKQAVSSLMFVRTTDNGIRCFRRDFARWFSVYSRLGTEFWEPAVVPEKELEIFRRVVSAGDEGLELIEIDERKFSKGQKVRVTGGVFAGAEGRIVRIKGDHRLVVEIQGICAVATSYIPKCHLQEILD